jgi:peptide/nickel transport system permease protein
VRVAKFLLWRVVRALLTLLTIIALTVTLYFSIERNPPVQFFYNQVSRGVPATPEQTHLVAHLFLLDRSKVGVYLDSVAHIARGDFGRVETIDNDKIVDQGPVGPFYVHAMWETLSILFGGMVVVLLVALPLGAIAGSRVGSWADRLISIGSLALVCIHPMMLGLILRSAGNSLDWVPTTGYCPLVRGSTDTCGGPAAWASHLALPWLTFGLLFLALYIRIVRATVAETIHEDFVRTARAKGASNPRVLARHVLPSGSTRILTMVGLETGTAIGVCIYLEAAFKIQGLGTAAVTQLGGQQPFIYLPTILAVVVLVTLVVIVTNLFVDLLYSVLDPRITADYRPRQSKEVAGGVF